MSVLAGAFAPSVPTYDLAAFGELAAQAQRRRSVADLEAIDRGLDRLVARPNRSSSGHRLALRLIRDARKHLLAASARRPIEKVGKPDRYLEPPTADDLDDVRRAVRVILDGLFNLRDRDLSALMSKFNGDPAVSLAVKGRQFRNRVATARARLWRQPGVESACGVVMHALGRWWHETIELLAPLTGSVAAA